MQSAQVSILTRPGGRVQPASARYSPDDHHRFNPHPSRRTGATICLLGWDKSGSRVSILTRPGGRVQPVCPYAQSAMCKFQSSPVPEDGCNEHTQIQSDVQTGLFQSSPVPKDGCNPCQPSGNRFVRSFNPHPSRRTGATVAGRRQNAVSECFNPHPSRRTGATFSTSLNRTS